MSVKGAFLCFNLMLWIWHLVKRTQRKKWTFAITHWLKYKQKSDGFNLNYNIWFSQNNIKNLVIKSSLWLIVHKYYFLFPSCQGNPPSLPHPTAFPSPFTSSWQSDWTSSPCLSWQSWAQGGQLRRRERAGCGLWLLRAPAPPPLPGAERPSPWPGSNAGAPPEIKHKNKHTIAAYKGKSTSRGWI